MPVIVRNKVNESVIHPLVVVPCSISLHMYIDSELILPKYQHNEEACRGQHNQMYSVHVISVCTLPVCKCDTDKSRQH